MRRGTTPTLTISTSFDLSAFQLVRVILRQCNVILVLNMDRLSICKEESGKYSISCELSQEETFMFSSNDSIKLQFRAKNSGDKAVASEIVNISLKDILEEDVF